MAGVSSLRAGQVAELRPSGSGATSHFVAVSSKGIERRTQWVSGFLTFDNHALADAIEEMNRYSRQKVVIADAALAEVRIGGRFRASDLRGFLQALRQATPVEVLWPEAGGTTGEPVVLKASPP